MDTHKKMLKFRFKKKKKRKPALAKIHLDFHGNRLRGCLRARFAPPGSLHHSPSFGVAASGRAGLRQGTGLRIPTPRCRQSGGRIHLATAGKRPGKGGRQRREVRAKLRLGDPYPFPPAKAVAVGAPAGSQVAPVRREKADPPPSGPLCPNPHPAKSLNLTHAMARSPGHSGVPPNASAKGSFFRHNSRKFAAEGRARRERRRDRSGRSTGVAVGRQQRPRSGMEGEVQFGYAGTFFPTGLRALAAPSKVGWKLSPNEASSPIGPPILWRRTKS